MEIIRYLEKNDEESTAYLNKWDVFKAKLRGKYIALNTFIKKQEHLKIK